jgi:hypothetical protein
LVSRLRRFIPSRLWSVIMLCPVVVVPNKEDRSLGRVIPGRSKLFLE